jgi:hypothetical protein
MLDTLTRPGFAGQVSTPIVEIPAPVPTVTGRHLAHARLSPSQRAEIAAAIQLGELRSERPTAEQVVELCHANRVYVRKARRATPAERRQLIRGAITIQQGLNRPTPSLKKKNGGWGALSDTCLEAAIREAGVGRVWDAIARIID